MGVKKVAPSVASMVEQRDDPWVSLMVDQTAGWMVSLKVASLVVETAVNLAEPMVDSRVLKKVVKLDSSWAECLALK